MTTFSEKLCFSNKYLVCLLRKYPVYFCEAEQEAAQLFYLTRGVHIFIENQTRSHWELIRTSTEGRLLMRSHLVYYNFNRNVVFTKSEVKTVWKRHFSDLATDEDGASKNVSQWIYETSHPLTAVERSNRMVRDHLYPFRDTPEQKPGVDGIPWEMWRLVQNNLEMVTLH